MRLKSLKLAGFKSFANTTTFTFPRGITAIVGPNGCGKSNVIDAIRWVLGETSAKQLRGGAMSDVIFAGTQDKPAKSVASVELTFEHTQDEQTGIRHEFNLYHELSVRRQVNTDGRSDYFINGTRARRRDVVDVFLGTGLGARSYAVIEQGMIGRIVDSSPMQLREFIEEAAGVSRYQARRLETQKKLEITQDNLARLHDVQSELANQQKRLSKQAVSAQHFEALSLARADTEQQLTIQQLYQAKHNQQQQKQAYVRSASAVTTTQSNYNTSKAQHDKLAARINQEQWLKDDAQSTYYQQQLSYQNSEHQLNDAKAQLSAITQQLSRLNQQREQTAADIERLKAEQTTQKNALKDLYPQIKALTDKRATYKRHEHPLQSAWTEAQDKLARLQDDTRTLEQQQAINAQQQKRYQQSYDKWQRRENHWQDLWQQLRQTLSTPNSDNKKAADTKDLHQTLNAQMAELNEQVQHIERQQAFVAEQLSELQPQAHKFELCLNTQNRELSELEKRQAVLASEYDTLHQILHPKLISKAKPHLSTSITDDLGVQSKDTVTHSHDELAVTTVREQIELSAIGQHHAELLDSVLALWLDSHVLLSHSNNLVSTEDSASHSQASSLWQQLKGNLADLITYQTAQNEHTNTKNKQRGAKGHSLWLPAKQSPDSKSAFMTALPDTLSDKVLPLSALIAKPKLALWQQSYLYTQNIDAIDQKTLIDILKALPLSATLLTTDGWMISRQGTINLSKFADKQEDRNSSFLAQRSQQRARLQVLEEKLNESDSYIKNQQKSIAKDQRDYDALRVHIEEYRAQAEQLTYDQYRHQQQLTTQRASIERIQADHQRLRADKVILEQDHLELKQEQQALNLEQQHIETKIAALKPQVVEQQALNQQLQAKRNEMRRMAQTDDDAWQALQLKVQKDEMRLEHSASSLSTAIEQYEKFLRDEQKLIAQLARYQQQLPELQEALQNTQELRDQQQALLAERESTLTALKQDYNQQQNELDALQHQLQSQQDDLAQLATELALSTARLEGASTRTQDALAKYQSISQQYDKDAPQTMSVSNLLADFIVHDRRVRPDKIAELQSEQAKLEHDLSQIGAVNLTAIAELAAVNERLEPLEQQTADIAASMQTLTEAIKSIDETTKTLFMQTLDAVNSELATLFAKVFGGGHASLTLNTDDMPAQLPIDQYKSEQWRAGLTLMAQPKGKRNSRLAVLSGGEKTLTALSLIFAIFKQHPAPFCVLDEVDAPLDDANVARFTSLIQELAGDLQFIFISHNKLSMQIADELKGITMAQAGVSTLVSVSLDEAIDYIDS